jgi:hypothetical protein
MVVRAVGSNLYPIPMRWDVLAGQLDINERSIGQCGRAGRRVRTGGRTVSLLERAVCRPPAPARSADCNKIPNHGADLLILRMVTGGRCWVRTNVGLADGFTVSRSQPIGIAADLRIHHSTQGRNRDLSVWRPWLRSVPSQRNAGSGSCPMTSSGVQPHPTIPLSFCHPRCCLKVVDAAGHDGADMFGDVLE